MLCFENELTPLEKRILARVGLGRGVNTQVIKKLALVKEDFDNSKWGDKKMRKW